MRLVAGVLLALVAASSNAQAQGLTDEQIARLVEHVKEFTGQTADAGFQCMARMRLEGSATEACKTFRAQSDSAQSMYFQMKEAITANPYQNAYFKNADTINAAKYNYARIRDSENTLYKMGLYRPHRY